MNMDLLQKVLSKAAGIPQQTLSKLALMVAAVAALYLAAEISWKLVPVSESQVPWQPVAAGSASSSSQSISLDALNKLALFGQANAKDKLPKPAPVAEMITDAPKTSLSIQLTGVVASTAEQKGLAVIESRGMQDTYGLGDKIKGTSASLKEVYADRVILANSGRYETLMLDGMPYTTESGANHQLQHAKVRKVDQRHNERVSEELEYSRDLLLEDPGKITDFIAISPVRQNGEVVGYRLNPGKDPGLFKAAGFRPNDLATSINGYDLTDMAQSIEVMSQLPNLSDVSVTVERHGQLVEILFSLPQH